MATDAVPLTVVLPQPTSFSPAEERSPSLPPAAVPGAALSLDASAASLPIAPLQPVELAPVPTIGTLLRLARATLGVLAHPYPRRAPRAPLSREEHLALAQLEGARLERERQAYRMAALGGPFR